MFDDDLPKKTPSEFPRIMDALSIDELRDYISDLQAEITKAEQEIAKKQASAAAADSFFKQ